MKISRRETVRKILHYTRKHNALIVVSLLLSLVFTGCNLYIPVLAGKAIDSIAGKGEVDFDSLKKALAGIIAVALISAVTQWIV
ncbi:MAG: ABC transporter ATP-binding protein, partial [Clostridia bacterium]|nr:ABC transporter ATP-binding protein [Clostridia bacterium]